MAKADLGTKRVCPVCQVRFYDLQKRPIECPKCHASFEPESLYKQRRPRQPEAAQPVPVAADENEEAEENEETEEAEVEEAEPVEEEAVVEIVAGDEDEEEVAATEDEEAADAGMTIVEPTAEGEIEDIEAEEVEDEDEADTGLLEEVEEDGDDVSGILDPGIRKEER